ncbi:MAG: SGNH/GDSL hydrolase family protein [bacterium]|jgi:acyl-CoA thioesterase-1
MKDNMIRVFFFGDSICFGQGVSIHRGWVTRIASELDKLSHSTGTGILLSNASINGNTTRLALERMPYDIQSQNPDILIVQFGMNDCNYWLSDRGVPRVSPQAFAANLAEIINRAFVFGVQKIFINTNHPTARDKETMPHTQVTYQQSNESYNAIIRDVVRQFDERVVLNDIEASFMEYIRTNHVPIENLLLPAPDQLHLSEEGHTLYFNLIYPKVEQAVRALIDR